VPPAPDAPTSTPGDALIVEPPTVAPRPVGSLPTNTLVIATIEPVSNTPTQPPIAQPTATNTTLPESQPTNTAQPPATGIPQPTDMALPASPTVTFSPVPTRTPTLIPTETPTLVPTETPTPVPTATFHPGTAYPGTAHADVHAAPDANGDADPNACAQCAGDKECRSQSGSGRADDHVDD